MDYEKFDDADQPLAPSRRWVWLLAAGVAVGLGFGGWALWRQQGVKAEAQRAARAEVEQAQTALAAAKRAVAERDVDAAERVRRLEALQRAWRAAVAAQPTQAPEWATEMRQVDEELDRLRSGDRLQLSLQREREAVDFTRAGNLSAAEAAWREALALQEEVNRNSGEASRNVDRELRLRQEVQRLQAEPLGVQLQALLGRAAQAAERGEFEEALARYAEARALQERLNREFPRSRYSDLAAVARIDAEISALSDDGLAKRIDTLWENGRRLAAEKSTEQAARAFVEAAETQRLLNERFPRSRFVSMEKLGEIDADRQTALALPRLTRVRELETQARTHLRRRQVFQAQLAVKEALELIEDLRRLLPRAQGLDEGLRLQLSFLNLRSAELAAVQDRFYEQLAPLAGKVPRAMLRTELTQADFARILNTNPSRTGGRALPVDSATHVEAEEFCRRLSWIMGLTVRLPGREEMVGAARDSGEFQKVEDGLDEWLATESVDRSVAPVWKATREPPETVARNSRSAKRGFRVVVEVDLTAVP